MKTLLAIALELAVPSPTPDWQGLLGEERVLGAYASCTDAGLPTEECTRFACREAVGACPSKRECPLVGALCPKLED